MNAFERRMDEDRRRLESLAADSRGKIRVYPALSGSKPSIKLELMYRTAGSVRYPREAAPSSIVQVSFPARYPFDPPSADVLTPIIHPNVYETGRICLGSRWIPTEGLDLFVRRIIRLLTFDPTLVNEQSPANSAALQWYRQAKRSSPEAFPTDRLETSPIAKKSIGWKTVSLEPNKVVLACPGCWKSLRVLEGYRGLVRCPACGREFRPFP